MEFDEAFEKLTAMAAGERCQLSYNRYSDPVYGIYSNIYCLMHGKDRPVFITFRHDNFEAALAEMAELLAKGKGEIK